MRVEESNAEEVREIGSTPKIYAADIRKLKLSEQYEKMLSLIPGEARRKAECFKREEDRVRSAAGALLIRRRIEETLRLRGLPSACHIAYGKYGKPYVAEYPDICFSLSHSGDMVVYIEAAKPVGIDVEEMNGDINCSEFDSYLTRQEMTRIMSSKSRIPEFYRIWTLREAFAKMTGYGLSLFNTEVPLIDHDRGRIAFGGEEYPVKSLIYENHMISVCMEDLQDDPHLHLITKDEWSR